MTTTDRQIWNVTPDLPLRSAPFLQWPLRPAAIAAHLARTWAPLRSRAFMLAVAFGLWHWGSPSMTQAASVEPGWVLGLWLRNVVLVLVVAGGLHLWLERWRRQGDGLRYDPRPLGRNKRLFLFDDQVKDNMFLTLVPCMLFGTAWEVLGWWSYANGWVSTITFADSPVWFMALLALIPLWSVCYFSVGHWLLHRGPVYAHVHSWHHKNVNVGPWSGLAMHPLEHVVLYGDVLLFLLIPSSPVHLLFAMMHHTMGAPMSHTGHDALLLPGGRRFELGDFFHQLHHRYIECNYGGEESPLDDLLDSVHDGTADGDRHVAERRRRLAATRRAMG